MMCCSTVTSRSAADGTSTPTTASRRRRAARRSAWSRPWEAAEDVIDAEVRADLDAWQAAGEVSFVGDDGPRRAPGARPEAPSALQHFHRTPAGRLRYVRGRDAGRRPDDGALGAFPGTQPRLAASAGVRAAESAYRAGKPR
jgi:hypothetical protein